MGIEHAGDVIRKNRYLWRVGIGDGLERFTKHDGVENSSTQRQVAERNLGRAHIANMNRLN